MNSMSDWLVYYCKRALYSCGRALYSIKRALHSIKRALHSIKRALYSMQTSSILLRKSLIFLWTYMYILKQTESDATVMNLMSDWPVYYCKKALYSCERAIFVHIELQRLWYREQWWISCQTDSYITRKEPYIHTKEPYIFTKEPYVHISCKHSSVYYYCKRALYFCERALYWSKEPPPPGGVFYLPCSLIKSRV